MDSSVHHRLKTSLLCQLNVQHSFCGPDFFLQIEMNYATVVRMDICKFYWTTKSDKVKDGRVVPVMRNGMNTTRDGAKIERREGTIFK
jgi:hypothetical protein